MSNTIQIKGNLGRDPELRFTQSGAPVLSLSIPDTPRQKNRDTGEWEDAGETTWFNVSVWGQQAETLAEVLTKGTLTTVTGTLRPRTYEHNGQNRVSFDVRAETVGWQPKRGAPAPSQAPSAPQQDAFGTGQPPTEAPF